ncbi:hypothetical protein [Leptolyngbya sp. FACHB-261]|uniref:hypothetical protein n=1 Tax=Leptolyngbya sp. FACHB-261 TaxID=2692806 RepID=UPI0016861FF2|nr:hypothetical protein [Leptolyngbya sp. FACHB-261]MBD2099996.1 hypothetical protein [Leptolyngbya sp. FACHB-261]
MNTSSYKPGIIEVYERLTQDLTLLTTCSLIGLLGFAKWQPSRVAGVADALTNSPLVSINASEEVKTLLQAISGQESGGNYAVTNASGSGATGAFQVMQENIPAWSQECLGQPANVEEFRNSPELQNQVVACKVDQYWQDALTQTDGDKLTACKRVAAQWYSGDPDRYTSTAAQSWNGDSYPSIASYATKVCSKTGW